MSCRFTLRYYLLTDLISFTLQLIKMPLCYFLWIHCVHCVFLTRFREKKIKSFTEFFRFALSPYVNKNIAMTQLGGSCGECPQTEKCMAQVVTDA